MNDELQAGKLLPDHPRDMLRWAEAVFTLFICLLLTGCGAVPRPLPPEEIQLQITLSTNLVVVQVGTGRSAFIHETNFPVATIILPTRTNNTVTGIDGTKYSLNPGDHPDGVIREQFTPRPGLHFPIGDTTVRASVAVHLTDDSADQESNTRRVSTASATFTLRVISTNPVVTPPSSPTPPSGFTILAHFGAPNFVDHPVWQMAEGGDGFLYGVTMPRPPSLDPYQVVKFAKNGANARTLLTNTAEFAALYGGPFVPQLVSTWDYVHNTNMIVGATHGGGTHPTNGIVFGIHEDGSHFRPLTHFRFQTLPSVTGQNGFKTKTLTKDRAGRIIGTTSEGGRLEVPVFGAGVLFDLWTHETNHVVQQRFSAELKNNYGVIFGSDSRLYGVSASLRPNNATNYSGGYFFTADADGGHLVVPFEFPQPAVVPTPGGFPYYRYPVAPRGGLVEHTNGYLYGAYGYERGWSDTPLLQLTNLNYYYRIARDDKGYWSFQILYRFSSSPAARTPAPESLVQGPDGKLYGFHLESDNELVALDPETCTPNIVHVFVGEETESGNSLHPHSTGALMLGSDGALYGTMLRGGLYDRGYLFRYVPPPAVPAVPTVAVPGARKGESGPEQSVDEDDPIVMNGAGGGTPPGGQSPMSAITLGTNHPGANIGRAVALSTNRLVIGVPFGTNLLYQGAAHVFEYDGTNWNLEATLEPGAGDGVRFFGFSAALDGDTLAIGAPGYFNTNLFAGAAYVFARTNGAWQQQAKLAGQNIPGDEFGDKVALDGDWLIVGAPGQTNNGPHTGAAWIFARAGTNWSVQTQLLGEDPRPNRYFGAAVAIKGTFPVYAAVGAPQGRELDIPLVRGEVQVFRRFFLWSFLTRLDSQYAYPGDYFGASLAMAPDRIVVGMPGSLPLDANDAKADRRGVTVFSRVGDLWTENTRIVPDQHRPLEMFGASVAFDGNLVTVGAPHDPEFFTGHPGATYVFTLSPDASTSSQLARLHVPGSDLADGFGLSVAQAGKTVAVAALLQNNTNALSGTVHLFDLTAPELAIRHEQGGVLLEWNPFYADFTLQTSPAVGPGADWQSVQPPPTGTTYLLQPTNNAGFYRLTKP